MKNIDKLARFITKNGTDGIMVHTIAGTRNWLVCQKVESDKWLLTLCNPMGEITYDLGNVTNKQHLLIWEELTRKEIEDKTSQVNLVKELKDKINKSQT